MSDEKYIDLLFRVNPDSAKAQETITQLQALRKGVNDLEDTSVDSATAAATFADTIKSIRSNPEIAILVSQLQSVKVTAADATDQLVGMQEAAQRGYGTAGGLQGPSPTPVVDNSDDGGDSGGGSTGGSLSGVRAAAQLANMAHAPAVAGGLRIFSDISRISTGLDGLGSSLEGLPGILGDAAVEGGEMAGAFGSILAVAGPLVGAAGLVALGFNQVKSELEPLSDGLKQGLIQKSTYDDVINSGKTLNDVMADAAKAADAQKVAEQKLADFRGVQASIYTQMAGNTQNNPTGPAVPDGVTPLGVKPVQTGRIGIGLQKPDAGVTGDIFNDFGINPVASVTPTTTTVSGTIGMGDVSDNALTDASKKVGYALANILIPAMKDLNAEVEKDTKSVADAAAKYNALESAKQNDIILANTQADKARKLAAEQIQQNAQFQAFDNESVKTVQQKIETTRADIESQKEAIAIIENADKNVNLSAQQRDQDRLAIAGYTLVIQNDGQAVQHLTDVSLELASTRENEAAATKLAAQNEKDLEAARQKAANEVDNIKQTLANMRTQQDKVLKEQALSDQEAAQAESDQKDQIRKKAQEADANALQAYNDSVDKSNRDFDETQLQKQNEFEKQYIRDRTDLNDQLNDLAGKRDVAGFIAAQQAGKKKLDREEQDNTEARALAQRAHRQQLDDMRAAYERAKSLRDQQEQDSLNQQRRSNNARQQLEIDDFNQRYALEQQKLAEATSALNNFFSNLALAATNMGNAAPTPAIQNWPGTGGSDTISGSFFGGGTEFSQGAGNTSGLGSSNTGGFGENIGGGGMLVPGFDSGIKTVPYDMIAMLHQGERVSNPRRGQSDGGDTTNHWDFSGANFGGADPDLIEKRVMTGVARGIRKLGKRL